MADVDEIGLSCPECGCRHLFVLYTRARGGGRILRRRECRNCGRRISTYETLPGRASAVGQKHDDVLDA